MATDLKQHNGITFICYQRFFFTLSSAKQSVSVMFMCFRKISSATVCTVRRPLWTPKCGDDFGQLSECISRQAIKRALRFWKPQYNSQKLEMLNEKTKRNIDTMSVWSGSQKLVGADMQRCDFFHKTCFF